ncbi:MAG: NADPH-dependent 7-cyano-7-deazaguanine reductase QueF, partial [Pseudomonadales bacterium]
MTGSPLGRESSYVDVYTPSLLHSIPRAEARASMGLGTEPLPFVGEDLWTAYELSWLDGRGRPRMGALRITVPASSAAIVESKSMKLYLNSFAQTRFNHAAEVLKTLNSDLTLAFRAPILVDLLSPAALATISDALPGQCLDDLDTEIDSYQYDPGLLQLEQSSFEVKEAVHTRAFR